MHEILHKMWMKTYFHSHSLSNFHFIQIFVSFHEGQLKQHMLQLLIWFLILLKWQSSSFRQHQLFPILLIKMLYNLIQQVPEFRKVGKSLYNTYG